MKILNSILLLLLLALPLKNLHAQTAPNIPLNIAGTAQLLSDYKGKLVYLDFWATWCTPCRKSFPWMNTMASKYKEKGFVIIAVNLDKDKTLIAKFLSKYPAHFKVAYDDSGVTAEKFNVKAMPTSFLIHRNGTIIMSHAGFREKDKEKIEQLIKSNL